MMPPYVKHSAKIEGDFVVFLIGAKIRKPWLIHRVLPIMSAMPRMLRELSKQPDLGLLHYETFGSLVVQYWRSLDHLLDYARNKDAEHLPAWRDFNRRIARSNAVGIWHETYLVRAGEYECVYGNMPLMGLAKAAECIDVTEQSDSAAQRLGHPSP